MSLSWVTIGHLFGDDLSSYRTNPLLLYQKDGNPNHIQVGTCMDLNDFLVLLLGSERMRPMKWRWGVDT